jgi:uncharacterized protein YdeI (BOF family)
VYRDIYIYISVRIQDKAWNRQKRNPKDSAEWGSFENKKTTEETLVIVQHQKTIFYI